MHAVTRMALTVFGYCLLLLVADPARSQSFEKCTEHQNLLEPDLRKKAPEAIIRDCTSYLNAVSGMTSSSGMGSQIKANFMGQAYMERARAYYRSGRYSEAIIDFNTLVNGGGKSADVYLLRGSSYEQVGNTTAAIADFRVVLTYPLTDYTKGAINQASQALTRLTGEADPSAVPGQPSPTKIVELTEPLIKADRILERDLIGDMRLCARAARGPLCFDKLNRAVAFIKKTKLQLKDYEAKVPANLRKTPSWMTKNIASAEEYTLKVAQRYGVSVSF